jgi:hypothetical protein
MYIHTHISKELKTPAKEETSMQIISPMHNVVSELGLAQWSFPRPGTSRFLPRKQQIMMTEITGFGDRP